MPNLLDDDCLEPEDQRKKQQEQANTNSAGLASVTPVTPAEYIYNSMLPPTAAPSETAPVARIGGKRERRDSGSALMSMDLFLSPEDVELDGGLGALSSDGAAPIRSLQSADFVKDLLLRPTAAAAAAANAAKAAPPPVADAAAATARRGMQRSPQREERERDKDDFCPIAHLTAKLERISTADEVAPLNENFRITSGDWVKDFEKESTGKSLGPMHPTLFMNANANSSSSIETADLSQAAMVHFRDDYQIPLASDHSIMSSDWAQIKEQLSTAPMTVHSPDEYQIPLAPDHSIMSSDWAQIKEKLSTALPSDPPRSRKAPPQSLPLPVSDSGPIAPTVPLARVPRAPTTGSATKGNASPSSSTTSDRKKRKKKRTIDESCPVTPTQNDVLFGRGGFTNTHPGNINFRKRALELRPWYEQSATSKEEKYRISDLLVESVKSSGHRFLERGPDGLWYEVIGNGARKKASQALRERVRGTKMAGNAGSVTSAKPSVPEAGGGGGHGGRTH